MTPTWFVLLCQLSVIACAVVSGVFLTFSDFVMRALDGAERAAGVEVMQNVNREVFRSVFMVLLLGMSALSPFLAGYAYLELAGSTAGLVAAGGTVYFVGVFLVTLVFNVPMNNRLAAEPHAGGAAAAYWSETYFPRWSFWNYVRAIAAAVAAACYLVACVGLGHEAIATG